jgi:uncharacterized protein YraI
LKEAKAEIMRAFHIAVAAGMGLAAVALSPAIASAADGFTTSPTSQRAGPGVRYPIVAMIPGRVPITIHGCVASATWCDVSWRGSRGWVSGGNIQVAWHGRRNPIISFYRQLGIPIITFGFDDYWNRYYRSKPFFKQRNDFGPGHRDNDKGKPGDHGKPSDNNGKPSSGNGKPWDNNGKPSGDNGKPSGNDHKPNFGNKDDHAPNSDNNKPPMMDQGHKGGPKGGDQGCKPGQNDGKDCRQDH